MQGGIASPKVMHVFFIGIWNLKNSFVILTQIIQSIMDNPVLFNLVAGMTLLFPTVSRRWLCRPPVVFAGKVPGNGNGRERRRIMDYAGLHKVKSVFRATARSGTLQSPRFD
jgi:hypothetical protein